MQVSNADAWQFGANDATDLNKARQGSPLTDFRAVSPAAPHVARNPEKLQKVLKQIGHGDEKNSESKIQSGFGALALCDGKTETNIGARLALDDTLNDSHDALDVAGVVREAEDRLESRLEEMVNAKVMEVLHMNLQQQRGGMP